MYKRLHAASIVLGMALTTPAAAAPPHATLHDFKTCIELAVDAGRLALFEPDGALGAAVDVARTFGADAMTPWHDGRWRMADVAPQADPRSAHAALATALPGQSFVSPVLFDDYGDPLLVTPDLLVRFESNVPTPVGRAELEARFAGAAIESDWGGMQGAFRVRAGFRDGWSVLDAANALAALPEVRWAQPDLVIVVHQHEELPNDPNFNNCWGIHNTGQPDNPGCNSGPNVDGVNDVDMNGPEAWCIEDGSNAILIVVMDDGVLQNHVDLNQVGGTDTTSQGPGNGGPVNVCDTHGTPVAGCATAIANNGTGVAGIAPGCRIASARCVISNVNNPCTSGGSAQTSWWVDALDWAVTIGARVTNNSNSFGFGDPSPVTDKYDETRVDDDIIHFASAGNTGGVIVYPALLNSVNAISAIDRDGGLDPSSAFGTGIAFAAPGREICSTSSNGGFTGCFNITSAASPAAAGVAALALSLDSSLSPAQVENVMRDGAKDLGPIGWDQSFGWGLVNAHGTLLEVLGCPGSGSCFEANGTPGCSVSTCCGLICGQDPFCCETEWDGLCANQAIEVCWNCGTPGSGACNQSNGTPGCDDAECCTAVCEQDAFCCSTTWDNICVGIAFDACGLAVNNDECANAEPYAQDVVFWDTTKATPDGPSHTEPGCDLFGPFYSDVWYDFYPECTGFVTLTANSPGNTMFLAIYDNCSCPVTTETLITCVSGDGTIQANALLFGGICYKVRLATPNPSPAAGTIAAQCAVFFDNCAGAWNIGDFEGTLGLATYGANTDGPVHSSCAVVGDDQIYHDVWFDWQAPCTGNLVVSTCGIADYDTRIAIYEDIACPVTSDRLIDCFDDHPACGGGTTIASVPVQAGSLYKVRVGSADPDQAPGLAGGEVSFQCVEAPSNDLCEDAAFTLLGLPTPFCNEYAQTDGPAHEFCSIGSQVLNDVWFKRTATCTGTMTISTCQNTDFIAKIAVYEDCGACPPVDLVTCGFNSSECPGKTVVDFDCVEGQCYLIRVGGANQFGVGCGELEFTCSSDACPADVNGDGAVDVQDLVEVILAWGSDEASPDVNDDGIVDVQDLVEVILAWGACP